MLEQTEQSSVVCSDIESDEAEVQVETGAVVISVSKVANDEETGAPVLYRLEMGVGATFVEGQGMQSLQLPHPRQIWPRPKSTEKKS